MANIIAVVWDFDKTLVNGYMEEPIFEHYGVDSSVFWREVNSLPEKYRVEQGVRVNPDTIYLNHFIHYAKKGIFKGLNHFSSFLQTFFSIVTVDDSKNMSRSDIHLRTFMVACRRSDAAKRITIDGQSFDIQDSASDTFERFFRFADTKFEMRALYLIGIETADRVSCAERHQIDKVYQRINLI